MDDLSAVISEVLKNPEALENLKSLAGSFIDSSDDATAKTKLDSNNNEGDTLGDLPFSTEDMQKFFKISSLLKSGNIDDSEAKILMTLRPHLGKKRQKKVDTAVKLLKLIKMIPIIKEMELF